MSERKVNKEKARIRALRYYYKHKLECNKRANTYWQNLRVEVMTKLCGGPPKCGCCGESNFEFLCVDHVNGKGNTHRKTFRAGAICLWLRKNNYPEGFQVLCHNCNMSKGFYGYCPHEKERLCLAAS